MQRSHTKLARKATHRVDSMKINMNSDYLNNVFDKKASPDWTLHSEAFFEPTDIPVHEVDDDRMRMSFSPLSPLPGTVNGEAHGQEESVAGLQETHVEFQSRQLYVDDDVSQPPASLNESTLPDDRIDSQALGSELVGTLSDEVIEDLYQSLPTEPGNSFRQKNPYLELNTQNQVFHCYENNDDELFSWSDDSDLLSEAPNSDVLLPDFDLLSILENNRQPSSAGNDEYDGINFGGEYNCQGDVSTEPPKPEAACITQSSLAPVTTVVMPLKQELSKAKRPQGERKRKKAKLVPKKKHNSPTKSRRPRNKFITPDYKRRYQNSYKEELDVLCLPGGLTNNNPGNKRYLKEALRLQPKYRKLPKAEKQFCSIELRDIIHNRGGKFLAFDKIKQQWYPIDDRRARVKCRQALNETKKEEIRPPLYT